MKQNLEKMLYSLFDFQRFEQNPHLEQQLQEVERTAVPLSDELLGQVAAAGESDDKKNPKFQIKETD